MDYRITADERSGFKRCRRQWDFTSPHRRDLEPIGSAPEPVPAAIKDALAVYYFPGMWDWSPEVVLPLVRKGLLRSIRDADAESGTALLERYLDWAPTVDEFAPIKIDHDVEGLVPDPRDPERGLLTPDGRRVLYTTRVDLLAIDAEDTYWVIRHQVVPEWQELQALLLDEMPVAACWAWEQSYLGMEIAGTIHNEILSAPGTESPAPTARVARSPVAQHEPSGGGRSIPQHRRLYTRSGRMKAGGRIEQRTAGPLRRTRIRRSRDEIHEMALRIGWEALDMTSEPAVYPVPAAHCRECRFARPCLAMTEGADPASALSSGYRRKPPEKLTQPRLGAANWSMGRGAAPPWTT